MENFGYIKTVASDLFRYGGKKTLSCFFKTYLFRPEFRYVFWLRTTCVLRNYRIMRVFHYLARYVLYRLRIRLGINIPYNTSIQGGFYIGHCGNINVNNMAVIGRNCNISSGVTIGSTPRGKKQGVPVIGDNVYVGPGAKIIGNIKVGNNVAIGANCVVIEDVPGCAVVVGVPGKIVSYNSSSGYVSHTDYETND